MSNRLGLISPSDLTDEQKPVHKLFYESTTRRYGDNPRTALDDGTMIGPFGVNLHHPKVGHHFHELAMAFQTIPGLSFYGREVVIAVSGARSHAAFENYAHAVIARRAGITEAELQDIHAGICPDTLTDEGKMAFEVSTALGKPGVLDQSIWDRAVKVLGKDGAAAVVHYTGFYSYVGILLNGLDAKVPEDA
jgi:hypothetical protein